MSSSLGLAGFIPNLFSYPLIMNKHPDIHLRPIRKEDPPLIEAAFANQGWNKPAEQFAGYFQMQESGERDILIAEASGQFCGYLTIVWKSGYPLFREEGIPEIVDFNVLEAYRRQGIGTILMDEAEARISPKSDRAGIGVGLTADYGAAQVLYVTRGYVPDGRGISFDNTPVIPGNSYEIQDDPVLHLWKRLL